MVLVSLSKSHYSCSFYSILIQAGVDVNAKDNDGWTPLHASSHWGHKEACEVLVEAMCDMDAKNKLVSRKTILCAGGRRVLACMCAVKQISSNLFVKF